LIDRKGNLLGIIGRELRNTLSDTWMNYAIPVHASVELKIRELVKDSQGRESEQERTVRISLPEFVQKGMRGEYKPISRPRPVAGEGGWHGIIFVPNILERTPAYVEDVVPGSPAAQAGLRPDDLISFVDGEPVVSIKAFQEWIRKNTRPGSTIRLEVRRGEALHTVELTLTAPPARPQPTRPPANAPDPKTPTPPPEVPQKNEAPRKNP
jgi:serine protease Do